MKRDGRELVGQVDEGVRQGGRKGNGFTVMRVSAVSPR